MKTSAWIACRPLIFTHFSGQLASPQASECTHACTRSPAAIQGVFPARLAQLRIEPPSQRRSYPQIRDALARRPTVEP